MADFACSEIGVAKEKRKQYELHYFDFSRICSWLYNKSTYSVSKQVELWFD